ncbi:TlpA family protein disulfide reductase [Saonia flava]|nr:TlpA family protein disulfide reductase [Saonia flava]
MQKITALLIFVFMAACGSKQKKEPQMLLADLITKETVKVDDINLPVYDFDGIEPLFHMEDNKTYVINFWATWCQPCVEELPYFEKLHMEQKDNNVEVVLVSLDMPKMWKSRLVPFLKKNNLRSKVIILDDPKQNTWIPKVDKEWSGGIPATIIYNKNKRTFYEQSFTYEELNSSLYTFIKN